MTETPNNDDKIDAAALGGGVVAVVMSMFSQEGAYDLVGATVAITLCFLVGGYLWSHSRRLPQSAAMAAVLSIVSVPIWGFIAEGPSTWRSINIPGYNDATDVSDLDTFLMWAAVAFLLFVLDCAIQSKRRRGDPAIRPSETKPEVQN